MQTYYNKYLDKKKIIFFIKIITYKIKKKHTNIAHKNNINLHNSGRFKKIHFTYVIFILYSNSLRKKKTENFINSIITIDYYFFYFLLRKRK